VQVAGVPPGAEFRRLARRETILGVFVLVLAIAFALYSWVRDTEQSDAYRAGLAAQQARDWDRATAEFRRAGDHPGADTALANAGTQVYERDRLYADAQEAARRDDWRTAAGALERVQRIQPGYKNSLRMLDSARERAQAPNPSGIVFLQGNRGDRDPGLYLVDAGGRPNLLPGSDAQSQVRARSADGLRFVYDRPRRYDDYPVTGPGSGLLPNAFSDYTIRRIPVLVTLTPGAGFTTHPLPMLDGEGRGVLASAGLAWTRTSTGETAFVPLDAEGRGPSRIYPIAREGERLLALDPARGSAILARNAGAMTELLMRESTGAARTLAYPVLGLVVTATVSLDGRWLLYMTQDAAPPNEAAMWVRSLEAAPSAPVSRPMLLGQTAPATGAEVATLRAAFVPAGGRTSEVIVERASAGRSVMTVYRLGTGDVTHSWTGAGRGDLGTPDAVFANGGNYLAVRRQYSKASILEVTRLTRPSYVTSWYAHFPATADVQMLAAFTPADDFVVAGVAQKNGAPGISLFTAQFGGSVGLGRLTFLGVAAPSEQRAFPTVATLADPAAVAFVTPDGALRVAPASGKQSTNVATGALAVWSLRESAVTRWIGE
jgi:hypothetical protein